MITASVKFKCKLCNSDDFYSMPDKIKTISGDYIRSVKAFKLVCKNCKKEYELIINIKAV